MGGGSSVSLLVGQLLSFDAATFRYPQTNQEVAKIQLVGGFNASEKYEFIIHLLITVKIKHI